MKRIIKLIMLSMITMTVFIDINIITSFAKDLSAIENTLNDIGVAQNYSENITNYIEELKVSQDELNSMLQDGKDILNIVGNKQSIKDFKFNEIASVYSEVMSIAKELNLNVSFGITTGKIKIVDKKTKNILFEGTLSDLKLYYNNLSQMTLSSDVINLANDITSEILDNNTDKESNILKTNNVDGILSEQATGNSDKYNNVSNYNDRNNTNNEYLVQDANNMTTTSSNIPFKSTDIIFLIGGVTIIGLLIKILLS